MKERLLFIGGVLDGKRLEVDSQHAEFRAQVSNPLSTTSCQDWETDQKRPMPAMDVDVYRQARFVDQCGKVHKVMVATFVKDPIRYLIAGYRPTEHPQDWRPGDTGRKSVR